jgi:flagellar basal body P-ring formation protein FlgA
VTSRLPLVVCAAALLAAPALAAPALAQQPRAAAFVAARALPRGWVLTADDMTTAGAEARQAPVGWTTKRMIAAGEPLRAPAIAPPDAIRAGQPVDVLWSDGAIRLRLKGTAMNAATLGARVTVRIDARRRLEGVATAPGTVQLNAQSR